MAEPWPVSLPQNQFVGLTEEDDDAILRTPMDAGAPTRRNRFSSVTRSMNVPLILDGTQKQTFDTFYRTTLKNGALPFDWEDPTTDATITLAFTKPPKWTLLQGGPVADRKWGTSLELEVQP